MLKHITFIMCPREVIKPIDVIQGIGLIWVDEYGNFELVKKPIKNTKKLKTLFDTTLKTAVKRMSNQLFFADSKQYKDPTSGKFDRNADIYLVSAICPKCRKATHELINKVKTKEIKCSKCKENIELEKARVREITGYNKTFIKKINKLSE